MPPIKLSSATSPKSSSSCVRAYERACGRACCPQAGGQPLTRGPGVPQAAPRERADVGTGIRDNLDPEIGTYNVFNV
ncbi:Uncharacterised protein [uncultured archaeon]|nr:Uncharacterised protein [uncultured archaeon]